MHQPTAILFFNLLQQCIKAGIKNKSAAIHAAGLARHAPLKPICGIKSIATSVLASISNTPANIANTEKPIPCIQNLYTLTPVSGI